MNRHRIRFEYYDSFTGLSLGMGEWTFDRTKSMRGYYSSLWRKWRPFLSNTYGVKINFVRAKITLY